MRKKIYYALFIERNIMKDLVIKYMLVKKIEDMKSKEIEDNNELLHMIIDCNEVSKRELEKFCKIKYELPIINSYAIIIKRKYLKKLKSINGIINIENDACLTAQSEKMVESDLKRLKNE